jgi:hypothetical protein
MRVRDWTKMNYTRMDSKAQPQYFIKRRISLLALSSTAFTYFLKLLINTHSNICFTTDALYLHNFIYPFHSSISFIMNVIIIASPTTESLTNSRLTLGGLVRTTWNVIRDISVALKSFLISWLIETIFRSNLLQ